jgi:D-tyrosyl-tRNA(Tyr) deacylase
VRGIVQRVRRAAVSVEGEPTREIGEGIVLLVGVGPEDEEPEARWMSEKCANLRIFSDDAGKMNRSLLETGGEALVVSQFTLFGDVRKGRRPSFVGAAPPEIAEPLCERVAELLKETGVRRVETGTFRAHMVVSLENDGPVTIFLETPTRSRP